MRIKDFEKAIDALNCAIEIDEFRTVNGGQVRCCLAHADHLLLLWDGFGRVFGIDLPDEVCTSASHEEFWEDDYDQRKEIYDLKFE